MRYNLKIDFYAKVLVESVSRPTTEIHDRNKFKIQFV